MQETKEKKIIEGRYQSIGVGTSYRHAPIATRYSIKVEEVLRAMEGRSDYIREAVMDKLKSDGLLD